jgi:hypothetical protein
MISDRATEELWARREDEVLGNTGHFSPWVTAPHSNTESGSLLYNAERPEGRQLMETPHLIQYTELILLHDNPHPSAARITTQQLEQFIRKY